MGRRKGKKEELPELKGPQDLLLRIIEIHDRLIEITRDVPSRAGEELVRDLHRLSDELTKLERAFIRRWGVPKEVFDRKIRDLRDDFSKAGLDDAVVQVLDAQVQRDFAEMRTLKQILKKRFETG